MPPLGTPSSVTSIVRSSSLAQIQRTGRANRKPPPHVIAFANCNPRTIAASRSGSTSSIGRPGTASPRNPSRTVSSSAGTPYRFAKPAAAWSRRLSGGPLTHPSSVRSGTSAGNANRRGPRNSSLGDTPRCSRASSGSCKPASMQAAAGSSSTPISSNRLRMRLLLPFEVELRDGSHQVAHPPDVRRSLRDRDRATRVEQVERVRALEDEVVRRQRQAALDQPPALGLVVVEVPPLHVDVGLFEVVVRPLALVLAVDVLPRDPLRPVEREHRRLVLNDHRE